MGTSDLFVRYLLGSEKNEDLLVDFINAVLVDSGFEPVKSARVTNPFNLQDYALDKETILDVKAVSESGELYNVEIQNHPENSYVKRSLYYWAQFYSSQLEKGSDYKALKPVICINLMSHRIFPESTKAHTCFMVTEKDSKDSILTDDLQINYIELPKFEEKYNMDSRLSLWAWFFRFAGIKEKEKDMEYLLKSDSVMEKSNNIYKYFTKDARLRELNFAREKRMKDEVSRISYAAEKGLREGLQQGLQQGLQKGRKEGILEGIQSNKLENAITLKKLGVAFDIISKTTGFSLDEIEKL